MLPLSCVVTVAPDPIKKLESESDAEPEAPRYLRVLAQITRLRRACCHPRLVMPESKIEGCKLETFLDPVEALMEDRHKALVFSQFVSHLEVVRTELYQRGIDYHYLDGSTPSKKRTQEVDAFQAGKGSLFLISLRAGGQGLNLRLPTMSFTWTRGGIPWSKIKPPIASTASAKPAP